MTLNDILNAIDGVCEVRLVVPITQRLSATVDLNPDSIDEVDDASARYGEREVKALRIGRWNGLDALVVELSAGA